MQKLNCESLVVYSSQSPLREPLKLFRQMLGDFKTGIALARGFCLRSLTLRYRRTLLGWLWFLLPVVATSATCIVLRRASVIPFRGSDTQYSLFILFGTVLWQYFAALVQVPLRVLEEFGSLLSRVKFPHEPLFLAGILETTLEFIVRTAIVLGLMLVLGMSFEISPEVLLSVSGLALFGLLIGFLLVPIGLLYGDIAHGLPIALGIWFLATPVAYEIPTREISLLSMLINPAALFLSAAREAMFGQPIEVSLALYTGVMLILLGILVAWVIYRVAIPILIERLA